MKQIISRICIVLFVLGAFSMRSDVCAKNIDQQISDQLQSPKLTPYADQNIGFPIACRLLKIKYRRFDERRAEKYDRVDSLIKARVARAHALGFVSARKEILFVLGERDQGQSNAILVNRAKMIDCAMTAILGMDPRYHVDRIKYFKIDTD